MDRGNQEDNSNANIIHKDRQDVAKSLESTEAEDLAFRDDSGRPNNDHSQSNGKNELQRTRSNGEERALAQIVVTTEAGDALVPVAQSTVSEPEREQEMKGDEDYEAPYCVFSETERKCLMVIASFAALISPFSSSIYYPAVNQLANDLNVSVSLINLTITTYLIFQGLAPSVTAAVSETYGRRPAYLACFTIYIAANLGLALQKNYAALLVLRCIQSSGSSGTVSLASGVCADLSTRAERGKYNAYIQMGSVLGPALAPVVGSLLSEYLGWRSLFWFLLILSGTVGSIVAVFLHETNRQMVGNGSIPPHKWARSLVQVIQDRNRSEPRREPDWSTLQKRKRRVNPLASVLLFRDFETFIVILYVSIQFAGYISITSILSSQLHERYNLSEVDVGLCYLPLGFGTLLSRWTVGFIIDWNFRREALKQGLPIIKNKQQDITNFDTEKARLACAFPLIAIGAACVLGYGWAMQYHAPLAVIEVILFFFGMVISGSFVCVGALVVDINRDRPASAAAAANLIRCLLAAGFVAAATPVINAIGIGWTSSLVVLLWAVCVPMLILVYRNGHRWRREKAAAKNSKEERSQTEV